MDEQLTPPEAAPPRDPPWGLFEALPIAVSAIALTALVVNALPRDVSGSFWLLPVFPLVLGGLTLAWISARYGGAGALRFRSGRPGGDILFGVVAGIVLFFVTIIIYRLEVFVVELFASGDVHVPRQLDLPDSLNAGDLSLLIAALLVAAPLGEEVFFRGFLFRAARRRLSWRSAAAFSALIFSGLHVDPRDPIPFLLLIVPLFVVGIGLASVYETRRSLLTSVVAHAVFNTIGLAIYIVTPR